MFAALATTVIAGLALGFRADAKQLILLVAIMAVGGTTVALINGMGIFFSLLTGVGLMVALQMGYFLSIMVQVLFDSAAEATSEGTGTHLQGGR